MEDEESDKTPASSVNANGAAKGIIFHSIHNTRNLHKYREDAYLN